VLATGETRSVREFCECAFREVGIELSWEGEGLNEKGIDRQNNRTLIEIDARYFRPTEVDLLLGDATKARELLGWEPETSFAQLVSEMVRTDVELLKRSNAV
jgi:GDPmannose 4,6-dehydratase